MMTSFQTYQSGLKALEKQNFVEAAELLQSYYQASPKPDSLEHYRACKALVKAYEQINQTENALSICQELLECDKPHIRSWAKRWHEKLSEQQLEAETAAHTSETQSPAEEIEPVSEPLTPTTAKELLEEGRQALRSQNHAQVIATLERFQNGVHPEHPDFNQARMWLATAYQKTEQLEKAQILGKTLSQVPDPATQAWGQQFLKGLTMVATVAPLTSTQPSTQSQTAENSPTEETSPSDFTPRSLADFQTFCKQNLVEDLKEYEAKRHGAVKAIIIGGVVLSILMTLLLTQGPKIVIGALFMGDLKLFLITIALFLFGIIGLLWAWAIYYSVQTEMYERGFKTRIIEKVMGFINTSQDLSYSVFGDNYLTRVAMLKSRLFPSLNQTFNLQQDDCVSGQVGPVNIFFSEVVAEHEIYHAFMGNLVPFMLRCRGNFFTLPIFILFLLFSLLKAIPFIFGRMIRGQRFDYEGFTEQVSNQVTRRKVFKGLFFRSNFNKHFQGETLVYADSVGANLKRFSKPKGSLVKLEDPEFSQLFTVYSDDQVEARFILSTSLMERLVQFRKKAKRKVSIAFAENQIFIAIHCDRDLFEARLYETMLSFKPMQDYFENFQLMLGIIEDLNLNRQIWGR